jgi:ring-1,2-phenylacetyl-CoA epoxidase subunit PaaE
MREPTKSRFHNLTVAEVRRETPDSVSILFAVPDELKDAFAFKAGQYLTLRTIIDGEDIRRSYSVCAGETDGELRVGIKKAPGGAFSAFANEILKAGDTIDVAPARGRFTQPVESTGQHTLGIAAGSGITPVLSIARTVLASNVNARFTLIYGNRTSQSVMFAEVLEDMKNRYLGRLAVIHMLSREVQDVSLLSGRITGDKIRALAAGVFTPQDVDQVFLCGPELMVAEVHQALVALGLPADRIRRELFNAAAPRRNFKAPAVVTVTDTVVSHIRVTVDGKRHAFDLLSTDESIIDAAARHGVELPFSCKGGMCCTCRCKVEAGHADMAVNYSLEEWEMKAGFILGCQARPTTKELALNFDEL